MDVGREGNGKLAVTNGAYLVSHTTFIGREDGSRGTLTIDGEDSLWWCHGTIFVGYSGTGSFSITGGAVAHTRYSSIGGQSLGHATIDGVGSMWTTSWVDVRNGILDIKHGGLIRLDGRYPYFPFAADEGSYIRMASGGMLAYYGNNEASMESFCGFSSENPLLYWDENISDWAPITDATRDVDYTLQYITEGDLAGYTLLTVGTIPEPASGLIAITGLALAVGASRGSPRPQR